MAVSTLTMDERKAAQLTEIRKAVNERGYYKKATCDDHRWDIQLHFAMISLANNPPADLAFSRKVSFEVTDWSVISR